MIDVPQQQLASDDSPRFFEREGDGPGDRTARMNHAIRIPESTGGRDLREVEATASHLVELIEKFRARHLGRCRCAFCLYAKEAMPSNLHETLGHLLFNLRCNAEFAFSEVPGAWRCG